jgi:hypothetical protein
MCSSPRNASRSGRSNIAVHLNWSNRMILGDSLNLALRGDGIPNDEDEDD